MGALVLILVIIGIVIFVKKKNNNEDKNTSSSSTRYSNEPTNYSEPKSNKPTYNFIPSTVIKDTEGNIIVNKSADELFEIGRSIYFRNPEFPSVDDREKATPYFEAAAQKGHLGAVKMASICRSIWCHTCLMAHGSMEWIFATVKDFWEDELIAFQMAYYWSEYILNSKSNFFTAEDRKHAQETIDTLSYAFGVTLFMLDKYTEAAAILSDAVEASDKVSDAALKLHVLYGACLYEHARRTSDASQMREAANNLKIIHNNGNYAKANKKNFEEFIYNCAANALSELYRVGHPSVASKDMTMSVNVLTKALDNLKYNEAKEGLAEKLSHYKKNPDGKYFYVE